MALRTSAGKTYSNFVHCSGRTSEARHKYRGAPVSGPVTGRGAITAETAPRDCTQGEVLRLTESEGGSGRTPRGAAKLPQKRESRRFASPTSGRYPPWPQRQACGCRLPAEPVQLPLEGPTARGLRRGLRAGRLQSSDPSPEAQDTTQRMSGGRFVGGSNTRGLTPGSTRHTSAGGLSGSRPPDCPAEKWAVTPEVLRDLSRLEY